MTEFVLQLDGLGTLQKQLHRALVERILDRSIPGGQRLPGTRSLARMHGLARNTVLAVYSQLEAEGYLRAQPGSGFVVTPLPATAQMPSPRVPKATEIALSVYASRAQQTVRARFTSNQARVDPLALDLRYGLPLPLPALRTQWRQALAWASARAALDYPPAEGLPELRRALASYLGRRRGFRVDPDQVLVVSGAQQALDLCVRVLAQPDGLALIEHPHYQGTRQVLDCAGLSYTALDVDAHGLRVEQLPARAGALLFLTPAHQFPTGCVLAPARRLAVLDWAERHQAWLIEDDYDGEFRFDAAPMPALKALDQSERVIYIGTVSKALFPAMRLGFLVLPAGLKPAFTAVKWLCDRGNSAIEQLALAHLIDSGRFEGVLRHAGRMLAQRRLALIAALESYLGGLGARIEGSAAGMHLCVWLPSCPVERSDDLLAAAARIGLGIYSIRPYFLEPPAELGLLMGYAALPPAQIAEAIARLATLLHAPEFRR